MLLEIRKYTLKKVMMNLEKYQVSRECQKLNIDYIVHTVAALQVRTLTKEDERCPFQSHHTFWLEILEMFHKAGHQLEKI